MVTNHIQFWLVHIMPRPRSRDKVVPVSIGIPVSLMMRLDNELDWNHSRSKWVKSAIISKLDDDFDYDSIPSKRLLVMLYNRGCIDWDTWIILKKQVEETAKKQ